LGLLPTTREHSMNNNMSYNTKEQDLRKSWSTIRKLLHTKFLIPRFVKDFGKTLMLLNNWNL
jgi:hypothetical protein